MSEHGNWEETNILNRLHHLELGDEETEARLKSARALLLKHRAGRIRPGWDDKVLSDWNGLMITALSNAAAAFGKPAWLDLARRAFNAIEEHMSDNGHLMHSFRLGQIKHFATADGYANMIRAAIVLYEVTAERTFLERAVMWANELHENYWDQDAGGYFFTSVRTEALITRTLSAADDAVPNANGVMLGNLARLHVMTGDDVFRTRGEALIQALQGPALAGVYAHATFFNSFEIWVETVQCILCGEPDDPGTRALADAILRRPIPNRSLSYVSDTDSLPQEHPAHGKARVDGKATLYVCKGTRCSLPVSDPAALGTLEGFL